MSFKRSNLWLCLPFIVVFICDACITLYGQPPEYWQGRRDCVNEVFPLFAWGLSKGPLAFILICVSWVAIFSALITVLPSIASEVLSLALFTGHTWGIMTWLTYQMRIDYHLCLLLFLFSCLIFIAAHRKWRSGRQMCKHESSKG